MADLRHFLWAREDLPRVFAAPGTVTVESHSISADPVEPTSQADSDAQVVAPKGDAGPSHATPAEAPKAEGAGEDPLKPTPQETVGDQPKAGGRKPKWDDLLELDEEMKAADPSVSDQKVVNRYNRNNGAAIASKKRATLKALQNARSYRKRE